MVVISASNVPSTAIIAGGFLVADIALSCGAKLTHYLGTFPPVAADKALNFATVDTCSAHEVPQLTVIANR